jgi:hypothetical protein
MKTNKIKEDMKVVVSNNADEYFKEHNITSKEWVNYCAKLYSLKPGDIVFYEGNTIGYNVPQVYLVRDLTDKLT